MRVPATRPSPGAYVDPDLAGALAMAAMDESFAREWLKGLVKRMDWQDKDPVDMTHQERLNALWDIAEETWARANKEKLN